MSDIFLFANHAWHIILFPLMLALIIGLMSAVVFRKNARLAMPFRQRLWRTAGLGLAASLISLGFSNGASTVLHYACVVLTIAAAEFYFLRLWK